MRTVLVTGGAGFIGAHLVARLCREDYRVIVVDDLSWGRDAKLAGLPGVELLRADIGDIGRFEASLAEVSHVFHLAALISAYDSLSEPDAYFRTNVAGLLRVIELCQKLSRPRLIFASTSGVYGNSPDPLKRESDLPQPITVYALTKLCGEQLLETYRSRIGFDDVSLRLFNVYGPGQNPAHPYANVTCKFARAAAVGEAVQLFGDGGQTRDFIYVDDVVDAFMLAATRPCKRRVYNVGTGQDASISALLEHVQEVSSRRLSVSRKPAWPNDIRAIRADASSLAEEHGFSPKVSLREGLRRTVESFRAGA